MTLEQRIIALAQAIGLDVKKALPIPVATYEDIPADAPLHQEYFVLTGTQAGKTFRCFDASVSPSLVGEIYIAGKSVIGLSSLAQEVLDAIAAGGGSNSAPTALGVAITGTATVGQTLTGSFTYADPDSDPAGTHTYKWYRADDNSGTNEAAISGATTTTYVLVAADAGKFIRFSVIPKATTGTLTGAETFSARTAAVANYTPAAPTNATVNDTTNMFGWTNTSGITSPSDYEYSTNSGSTWTTATSNPQDVGNIAIASGAAQVRVKAATGRNASAALVSGAAFTVSAGGAVDVTYNNTLNFAVSGGNDVRRSGSVGRASSDQSITADSTEKFTFYPNPDGAETGLIDVYAHLVPLSGAPYTTTDASAFMQAGVPLRIHGYVGGAQVKRDANVYGTDASAIVPANKLSFGFTGTRKPTLFVNDVAFYVSPTTAAAGEYILFLILNNGVTSVGLNNVVVE
jgi:hypothetical protein